jgi:hypothetical protein
VKSAISYEKREIRDIATSSQILMYAMSSQRGMEKPSKLDEYTGVKEKCFSPN